MIRDKRAVAVLIHAVLSSRTQPGNSGQDTGAFFFRNSAPPNIIFAMTPPVDVAEPPILSLFIRTSQVTLVPYSGTYYQPQTEDSVVPVMEDLWR